MSRVPCCRPCPLTSVPELGAKMGVAAGETVYGPNHTELMI